MTGLEFDKAAHRYTLDGKEIPSVTRIIRELSFADLQMVDPDVLARAAAFGTAVHELTEHHDRYGFQPWMYDCDPRELRALRAWTDFIRDTGFQPTAIEERLHHPVLLYAGTIDRVGTMRRPEREVVLDIKTSWPHGWHGIQLAAYLPLAMMARKAGPNAKRIAVYLDGDTGRYQVRAYDSPEDWRTFMAEFRKFTTGAQTTRYEDWRERWANNPWRQ